MGAAATYNIGSMPSVGTSFSGTASGGYLVGARYKVIIGNNGPSSSVGFGVGLGAGKNMAVTRTIKLWPQLKLKND